MPRFRGIKSNATGYTAMLKPSCKRRGGKTGKNCRLWIATKNIAAKQALGYKKDPDQTPQKSKTARASR